MLLLKNDLKNTKNTKIVFSKKDTANYKEVLFQMLSLLEDISTYDVLYIKHTSKLTCKIYCLLAEQDGNKFCTLYNLFSQYLYAYTEKLINVYANIDYDCITDLVRRVSTKVGATKILNKADKLIDLNNYMISMLCRYDINIIIN